MKRHALLIVVIGLLVVLLGSTPCFAMEKNYDFYKTIKLVIGQKEAEVNLLPAMMDQPAYTKSGRTLVPLRFLGESLGAEVTWDSAKNQAKLKTSDIEVIVILGSKAAYIDGKMTTLDVPAESKGGRIFVPLRFVSESLGAVVNYDDSTQTISVRYIDTSKWTTFTDPDTGVEYKHPSDWKVESTEQGVVVTSPTGSAMCANIVTDKPQDIYDVITEIGKKNGWTLENEFLNVPGDLEQGYELQFSQYDGNDLVWMDVICDRVNDLSIVGEINVKDENFDEVLIMSYILFS
jgi:hypothetical protein